MSIGRVLRQRRFRLLIATASALPLVLALVSLWVMTATANDLQSTLRTVDETRAAIDATEAVLRIALDVETGVRGFLLTGEADFLEPLEHGAAQLPNALAQLRLHTAADPDVAALSSALQQAAEERVAFAVDRIALTRERGTQLPDHAWGVVKGKQLMDHVRTVSSALIAQQDRRIASQQQTLVEAMARQRFVTMVTVAALGFLSSVIAVFLWRVTRQQNLAVMCAWSRTIEHQGVWLSFEDYLEKHFGVRTSHGISPAEAAKMRSTMPDE